MGEGVLIENVVGDGGGDRSVVPHDRGGPDGVERIGPGHNDSRRRAATLRAKDRQVRIVLQCQGDGTFEGQDGVV